MLSATGPYVLRGGIQEIDGEAISGGTSRCPRQQPLQYVRGKTQLPVKGFRNSSD